MGLYFSSRLLARTLECRLGSCFRPTTWRHGSRSYVPGSDRPAAAVAGCAVTLRWSDCVPWLGVNTVRQGESSASIACPGWRSRVPKGVTADGQRNTRRSMSAFELRLRNCRPGSYAPWPVLSTLVPTTHAVFRARSVRRLRPRREGPCPRARHIGQWPPRGASWLRHRRSPTDW